MDKTEIQWSDSSVNPIMGCKGCELFSAPAKILKEVDQAIKEQNSKWTKGRAREIYQGLVNEAYNKIEVPREGQISDVTTTNIDHLKKKFVDSVSRECGKAAAKSAEVVIESNITCYAAKGHFRWGDSLLPVVRAGEKPRPRNLNTGFAPTFELLKRFPGRVADMAAERDLLGTKDPDMLESGKPGRTWIKGLPKLIFVSDMGDAFSREEDFDFLKEDTLPPITSEDGKRHLWLWLTKRPATMKKFATQIGGWPENVCAMTTLTQADNANLNRLKQLKEVSAEVRGLSIEPLWDRIPPEDFSLEGIDWVIVGGESGDGESIRPFNVEWARELRDHCRKSGVAFFMKQMGRNPVDGEGKPIKLKDSHGGDWDEWDAAGLGDLNIREFPQHFHDYRKEELPTKLKPIRRKEWADKPSANNVEKLTSDEKVEFKRLSRTVEKGAKAFVDTGLALVAIMEKKLYREKYATFEDYCSSVHNMCRSQAYQLASAGKVYHELSTIVDKGSPLLDQIKNEAQVRELARLADTQSRLEVLEMLQDEDEAPTAKRIHDIVDVKLNEIPKPETKRPPSLSQRIEAARALVDQFEAKLGGKFSQEELRAWLEDLRQALN